MYTKILLYDLGQYQRRTFSSIKDPKTQILQLFKLIGFFYTETRSCACTPGLTFECILHGQIAYIGFEIQLLQRSGKTTDHTLHSEAQLYQAQKPDTSCN